MSKTLHHLAAYPAPNAAPPALLGGILELLVAAADETDRYERLRWSQGNVFITEPPDTAEAFNWIRTAVQDITATPEALARDPPLHGQEARAPDLKRRTIRPAQVITCSSPKSSPVVQRVPS
jgi:hypothetical protein